MTVSVRETFTVIVGALLVGFSIVPSNAFTADIPTSPTAQSSHDISLPTLLPEADAARYRDIFSLQTKSRWAEADRLIVALTDRLLMAEVEAQRYLSPTYRARYGQLHDWLEANADAPDAARIYRLAVKKRSTNDLAPAQPAIGTGLGGEPEKAEPRHRISIGIGDEGVNDRHGQSAAWLDGLAAWRAGHIDKARHEFEALAKSGDKSPWVISAAAYWAARGELRMGHPELFNYWLGIAAKNPRTFYGLLARRTLGVDSYIEFDRTNFGELDAQILTGVPAGRRALALVQIGETDRAEAELRGLALRASSNTLSAIVALADRANMPSLSVTIAAQVATSHDDNHDRAQYPVPRWKPRDGFHVDRALLYGLMRQESRFEPVAHNPSGASGLMQLMPGTARTMAAHTGVHGSVSDPGVNLTLAQQYVIELLSDSRVNGNLLYFAVAYNRGPNSLPKMKAESANHGDPLLFVESVSNKETRLFIHQVLTNYWIYRLRLGQPSPDLDALAAGEWPIYTALDNSAEARIRHAENR
jgi:soluble lytic murein transglycosylase